MREQLLENLQLALRELLQEAGDGGEIPTAVLADMRDALAHRGPDDAGMFRGPGVGLCARRLQVQDLSQSGGYVGSAESKNGHG